MRSGHRCASKSFRVRSRRAFSKDHTVTAPITSNGPITTRLHHYAGHYCSLSCSSGIKLSQHTHTSSPTGTKLSQHTHTSSTTGTKLSQHAQNCPFQPVLPEQGELCTARTTTPPSRENFVPHLAPNPVQNSPSTPVLQRFREKVRPAHPTPQQNREKVRPALLKTAFFASFAPAGRIFSRTSKQQATQGELFRALGIEQEVLTKVVCADI